MPTVDEVALASDEEVLTHLRQLLRPGEDFQLAYEDKLWVARLHLRQGEESKLLWDQLGYDHRALLLDAYGWLWKRTNPPVSALWQRRRELTREDVLRRAISSKEPDPEDVNPEEVRAVYEGQHSHRDKKV